MGFQIAEATIAEMQHAMEAGETTSAQLVLTYMERIAEIDKAGARLNAVLELNPDALFIAEAMDAERAVQGARGPLHGIPVLVKDNIDTADKMHTSAGSLALADHHAQEDAFLVGRLREAGAVVLGKANLTEFANFMTVDMPSGYSSRGGQVLNPYGPGSFFVGGSSSGSAAAVAASLCAVAVGTETCGSIINPACMNGIVGIKPTVGLISRSGIIPISNSQDTAGPMGRTVADAAILLGAMAGVDDRDPATWPSRWKARIDYTPFLDPHALQGSRIGVNRGYWHDLNDEERALFEQALARLRDAGAVLVEGADIPYISEHSSVLLEEFKSSLNAYLAKCRAGEAVRSLLDVIMFNREHPDRTLKYGQVLLERAQFETDGTLTAPGYIRDRLNDLRASRADGIDRLMDACGLDAILCPGVTDVAAVAGYPAVNVPAGFTPAGMPFGVSFVGRAFGEPDLIRLAYAFEQATSFRRPPF